MNSYHLNGITLECLQGDITLQADLEAIVNAANAQLLPGGGVAGAIHRAAGPGLFEECRHLAPIEPGQAVITGAHKLPNRYVIHCLGPVYGRDRPEAELLANCYLNALDLAEENAIRSIGFPAISTGIFGYPMEEATEQCMKAVESALPKLKSVLLIRFILFDAASLDAYKVRLTAMASRFG